MGRLPSRPPSHHLLRCSLLLFALLHLQVALGANEEENIDTAKPCVRQKPGIVALVFALTVFSFLLFSTHSNMTLVRREVHCLASEYAAGRTAVAHYCQDTQRAADCKSVSVQYSDARHEVTIYEVWASEAALGNHYVSAAYKAFQHASIDSLARPTTTSTIQVPGQCREDRIIIRSSRPFSPSSSAPHAHSRLEPSILRSSDPAASWWEE